MKLRYAFAFLLCPFLFSPVLADDPASEGEPKEEVEKELSFKERVDADADDVEALNEYAGEIFRGVFEMMKDDPDGANKQLDEFGEYLKTLEPEKKEAKALVARAKSFIGSMKERIEGQKRLKELEGKDAIPLKVKAWANGDELTDADLKGKVVLLDFWAVWCGPCIATFPHLKEWHDEYADKGLVILGLTDYYQFTWDEENERAKRGKDVEPEEELKMLNHFAESHDLKHRFAIQDGDTMSDYYAVQGIPHLVLIDQEGKIRLVRVGSSPANVKDVSDTLKELLGKS